MKRLALFTYFAVLAAGAPVALAQTRDNAAAIRAGKNIAVTSCVACHMVSPGQTLQPIAGSGRSFADIANRQGLTQDSLSAAMVSTKGHDPNKTGTLLPMAGISETERAQVSIYILSLRAAR